MRGSLHEPIINTYIVRDIVHNFAAIKAYETKTGDSGDERGCEYDRRRVRNRDGERKKKDNRN